MMASVAARELRFWPGWAAARSGTDTLVVDFDGPRKRLRSSRITMDRNGYYDIVVDLGQQARPDWIMPTLSSIVQFLTLPPGWNSHAAAPVTLTAAQVGLDVLVAAAEQAAPAPAVVPLSSGGLQIEWHAGGIDLEVAIDHDGSVDLLFEDLESGDRSEQDLRGDLAPLWPFLALLAQRTAA
jgi:hypothetical protein